MQVYSYTITMENGSATGSIEATDEQSAESRIRSIYDGSGTDTPVKIIDLTIQPPYVPLEPEPEEASEA